MIWDTYTIALTNHNGGEWSGGEYHTLEAAKERMAFQVDCYPIAHAAIYGWYDGNTDMRCSPEPLAEWCAS